MPRLRLIVAVWSFVAAPALCRAGVLTTCCTHGDVPIASPVCCDGHGNAPSDGPPGHEPTERECGSCADVCNGIAKLAEERSLPNMADHEQPWNSATTPEPLMESIAAGCMAFDCVLRGPCLPYPASDLPLRI